MADDDKNNANEEADNSKKRTLEETVAEEDDGTQEPPTKQIKSDSDAPETTATESAADPETEGTTEKTAEATETPPEDDKTATEPPASVPGLPPGVPPLNGGTDAPAATTPGDDEDSTIEEKAEVSALYVGRVIGKGGEMIRDLQARSGCRMDVDQNVPAGSPRIITYRGTRKTVDFAKEMVAMLCTPNGNEAQLPLGEASREQVQVPSTAVGKIIGRGGEMIRELQSKSQAKIQVDHAVGPSDTRTVTITGTPPSVIKAKEMVEFLVANPMMDAMAAIQMLLQDKMHRGGQWGSGPPYPNMPSQGQGMTGGGMFGGSGGGGGGGGGYGQNSYGPPQNQQYGYQQQAPPQQYGGQQQQSSNYYGGGGGGSGGAPGGGGETEVFFAAKMYMGRIIGQKGVTVNDLQKRSGCDIQINQDVPPGQDCEITLRGTRTGIESAKKMLNDIIQMGPAHPYAGGGGQYQGTGQGGYNQQQAYGGGGGYGAPGGGSMYGQQQQVYGQQQYGQQQQQPVYGMQQQQQYQAPTAAAPAQYGRPQAGFAQPSPWKTATAADGQVYYYHEKTGETRWDKPPGMP